jgi:Domain of unknown function (DUF4279)
VAVEVHPDSQHSREVPEVYAGRSKMSLRIRGPLLEPANVSAVLQVEPDFAVRRGDTYRRRQTEVVAEVGVWRLGLDTQPGWSVDEAIVRLLGAVPVPVSAWSDLADLDVDLFCGLFMGEDNQGTAVSASTLGLLAERGIRLVLDVYGP